MTFKIPDFEIPFDKDGNQLGYYDSFYAKELRKNEAFKASLRYVGYSRGRSSAKIVFMLAETDRRVEMFLTDFDAAVFHMVRGVVTGTFCYTKRGENYGVKLLEAS